MNYVPKNDWNAISCRRVYTRSQALGGASRLPRDLAVQQWERGYAARRSCFALESGCMTSNVPKAPGHHLLRNRRLYLQSIPLTIEGSYNSCVCLQLLQEVNS